MLKPVFCQLLSDLLFEFLLLIQSFQFLISSMADTENVKYPVYATVQKGVLLIVADSGGCRSAIPKRRYSEDSPVQCSTVTLTPTL